MQAHKSFQNTSQHLIIDAKSLYRTHRDGEEKFDFVVTYSMSDLIEKSKITVKQLITLLGTAKNASELLIKDKGFMAMEELFVFDFPEVMSQEITGIDLIKEFEKNSSVLKKILDSSETTLKFYCALLLTKAITNPEKNSLAVLLTETVTNSENTSQPISDVYFFLAQYFVKIKNLPAEELCLRAGLQAGSVECLHALKACRSYNEVEKLEFCLQHIAKLDLPDNHKEDHKNLILDTLYALTNNLIYLQNEVNLQPLSGQHLLTIFTQHLHAKNTKENPLETILILVLSNTAVAERFNEAFIDNLLKTKNIHTVPYNTYKSMDRRFGFFIVGEALQKQDRNHLANLFFEKGKALGDISCIKKLADDERDERVFQISKDAYALHIHITGNSFKKYKSLNDVKNKVKENESSDTAKAYRLALLVNKLCGDVIFCVTKSNSYTLSQIEADENLLAFDSEINKDVEDIRSNKDLIYKLFETIQANNINQQYYKKAERNLFQLQRLLLSHGLKRVDHHLKLKGQKLFLLKINSVNQVENNPVREVKAETNQTTLQPFGLFTAQYTHLNENKNSTQTNNTSLEGDPRIGNKNL